MKQMDKSDVVFLDKIFCFTGTMKTLKRTAAQREVRMRGGNHVKVVGKETDYLVVGSLGSPEWKHGDFGRKIEHAINLKKKIKKPHLVSESDFMDALGQYPPTESGEEYSRTLLVCNYKFRFEIDTRDESSSLDFEGLGTLLEKLITENELICSFETYEVDSHDFLFEDEKGEIVIDENPIDAYYLKIRVVKETEIDADPWEHIEMLERNFEGIRGCDGDLSWYSRKEGTNSYIKLHTQSMIFKEHMEKELGIQIP